MTIIKQENKIWKIPKEETCAITCMLEYQRKATVTASFSDNVFIEVIQR